MSKRINLLNGVYWIHSRTSTGGFTDGAGAGNFGTLYDGNGEVIGTNVRYEGLVYEAQKLRAIVSQWESGTLRGPEALAAISQLVEGE